MALINWDDEQKKKDELFSTPIKTIASVQSGAWQPAPSGADSAVASSDAIAPKVDGGIFDQQNDQSQPFQGNYLLSDEKAQIDEQKRKHDAEIELARQQEAARQERARAAAEYQAAINSKSKPQVSTNYIPAKKSEGGVKGFLKGVGAGIEQDLSKAADVVIKGGGIVDYAGRRLGGVEDGAAAAQSVSDANKVRNWLFSKKDIAGRNLAGTKDVEDAAYRVQSGNGSLRDYASLAGESLQTALAATMFLNPARLATGAAKEVAAPVISESANILAKTAANPAVRYAMRDAAFFGGLQGTATFQRVYGETGDVTQSLEAAAKDAIIGGALQGTLDIAGRGVGVGANRTLNSLRRGENIPTVDINGRPVEEGAQAAGAKPPDTPPPEQAPAAADGVARPNDGNISFERPVQTPDLSVNPNEVTPAADGVVTTSSPEVTPVGDNIIDAPAPEVTPAADVPPAQGADVAPVADGVARPAEAIPVTDANTPVIPGENVRALQESIPGKSQADEAAIAQRIQELQNTPRGDRTEAQSSELNNKILGGFNKVRKQLGSDEAFYNDFILPEADKPTRSADLAQEIIGSVENDGMSIKDAIDSSITPERPKTTQETAQDSYASLSTMIRELEKSSNQPGLWKNVQNEMQGMTTEQRVEYLNNAWKNMRDSGTLAKDYVNKQNNFVPETPTPVARTAPQIDTPAPAQVLPENIAPARENSLPDNMGVTPEATNQLTKQQIADRLISNVNHVEDAKTQLAKGLDIPLDSELPVSEMLKTSGVNDKSAQIIESNFDTLKKNDAIYNKIQEANRADYTAGKSVNAEIDRTRNKALGDSLEALSGAMKEIRYIKRQGDVSERAVQALEGVVKYRAVNVLSSLGLFERNAAQEIVATAFRTAQNPIKSISGMVGYGNPAVSAVKATARDVKDVPHGITSKARHASSSVYKAGMTVTDALQQTRAGMYRDEIARQALKMGGNKNPSISEIRQLSKRHGALGEAVAQMYVAADSQVISRKSALRAGDALMQFLRTGSDGDLKAVNNAIENTSTVSDGIIKQLEATGKMNGKVGRALISVFNGTFMFTRVATNAARNSAEVFNPFSPSLVDSIGRTNRGRGANLALSLKSKPVAYAMLGAVPAMYAAGSIGYNDGEDVDKPRGVWIKKPGGGYIVSRSTGLLELPIGIMVLGSELYKDAQTDNMRDAGYYSGIITQSLPYIDSAEQANGAVTSLFNTFFGGNTETGDGGYKAGSYVVNTAKSLVPFSNNSVQPYIEGKQGNSVNLKSTYANKEVPDGEGGTKKVPDLMQWFKNSMANAYPQLFPDSYSNLKDSRDAAGRVRTVDNQGVVIRKNINDVGTAEFNDRITEAVNYNRKAGLGKNVQDMFNTYDTGKNNNFKSVQDSITFLDAPTMNGKTTPDKTKKLEKNGKLANLSQQIRKGFYGDTGSELLTLDGQNLKSDASVPNKSGSKNTKLPVSMQSIKNAIAATDLPKDQSDKLYAISGQSTELYKQLKAKNISYDQYSAAKSKLSKQEISILSGSKNYKKMVALFDQLDQSGFFKADGLGSTKSGQTYLWNSLNALLGSKGATPAANYPDSSKGFTPWGNRGTGRSATNKPSGRGNTGLKWTPVGKRQQASVAPAKYTPVSIKVKLGNAVKKDKTQDYSTRSF